MMAYKSVIVLLMLLITLTNKTNAQNDDVSIEIGAKLYLIATENTSFPKSTLDLNNKINFIDASVSKVKDIENAYLVELFRFNPISTRLYLIDKYIDPDWAKMFTLRVFNQDSINYFIDSMDAILEEINIQIDQSDTWLVLDSLYDLKKNKTNIACTYSLIILIDDLRRIKYYRLSGFETNDFYCFYKDVICGKRFLSLFNGPKTKKKIIKQLEDISKESVYGIDLIDLYMNRRKIKKDNYNPNFCSLQRGLHQ